MALSDNTATSNQTWWIAAKEHKMHQANRDKANANANALRVENIIKLNRKNGNSYQANDSNSVLIFIWNIIT